MKRSVLDERDVDTAVTTAVQVERGSRSAAGQRLLLRCAGAIGVEAGEPGFGGPVVADGRGQGYYPVQYPRFSGG